MIWTAPHGNACAACHSSDNSPLPSSLPANDSHRQSVWNSLHAHFDDTAAGGIDVTILQHSLSSSSSSLQKFNAATDATSPPCAANPVLSLACACCDLWYHNYRACAGPYAHRGAHHIDDTDTRSRGCSSSSGDGSADHWLCPLCWADNAPSDARPWRENIRAEDKSLIWPLSQTENPYRRSYSYSRRANSVAGAEPQRDEQSALSTFASNVDESNSTVAIDSSAIDSSENVLIYKGISHSIQSVQRVKLSAQQDQANSTEEWSFRRFDPLAVLPDVLLLTKVMPNLSKQSKKNKRTIGLSTFVWYGHFYSKHEFFFRCLGF